jgi:DNA invertase Pin-like site-specific DNA recombinase
MDRVYFGYSRVSKENKSGKNLSLDEQESWLVGECERRGVALLMASEGDGVSGRAISNRPVLKEILRKLDKGEAHGLIVKKLDRLARDTYDFLYILNRSKKGKWALVIGDLDIDTSTPMGEAMATISATFAQLERARIIERRKADHQYRKSIGKTNPMLKVLTSPEIDQSILTARLEEKLSFHAIARRLNEQGVPTSRNGKQWHASTVKYAVDRLSA